MLVLFCLIIIAIIAWRISVAVSADKGSDITSDFFFKEGARSILDLIDIDLRNFPDESCELILEDETSKHYKRDLKNKQFGIFDALTIIVVQPGFLNVIFRTNAENVTINDVSKIVNTLYNLYGVDDNGDGKFTCQDRDNYLSGYFNRGWLDAKIPVSISLDDDELQLTVWTNFVAKNSNLLSVNIKGTNYRKDSLEPGSYKARLIPEVDNRYDPYAIQIVADNGAVLGYFPAGNDYLFSLLNENKDSESFPVTAILSEEINDNGYEVLTGRAIIDITKMKGLDVSLLKGIGDV